MSPLVSVIIPVRDRPVMLARAISSVLAQLYTPYELIVVDDGSTVDLSEVERLVRDSGHHWIAQPGRGVSSARNTGVRASSGKWLAFLDSDDEWLPEKLFKQIVFHKEYSHYSISQCEETWIRKGKRVNKKAIHQMPDGEAFYRSLELCCISPSSVFLKRTLFDECGPFDEQMRVCEDYDLWLRITAREHIGLLREELVMKYGGHADQLSRSEAAIDRFRLYALLKLLRSGELSKEQMTACREEAQRRAEILKLGAEKRALATQKLYRDIHDHLLRKQPVVDSSFLSLAGNSLTS